MKLQDDDAKLWAQEDVSVDVINWLWYHTHCQELPLARDSHGCISVEVRGLHNAGLHVDSLMFFCPDWFKCFSCAAEP